MDATSLTDALATTGIIAVTIGLFALIARDIWKDSTSKKDALKRFGLVVLFFLTAVALLATLGNPAVECQ